MNLVRLSLRRGEAVAEERLAEDEAEAFEATVAAAAAGGSMNRLRPREHATHGA